MHKYQHKFHYLNKHETKNVHYTISVEAPMSMYAWFPVENKDEIIDRVAFDLDSPVYLRVIIVDD